jgi:hypothetical protein
MNGKKPGSIVFPNIFVAIWTYCYHIAWFM